MQASRRFYELAAAHGGYFTTREASAADLSYRQLSYYTTAGELERVAHGVYRLVDYPPHRHGDMIAATLWAGPKCAISYESALVVYELASAMPAVIHLTVPGPYRGKRKGVHVHHEDLPPEDQRVWDDVPVTAVERTLIDVARRNDWYLLRDAAREALDRGLTTPKRLALAVDRRPDRTHIRRGIGIRLPAVKALA